MGIVFPRIDIKINMRGLAQSMRASIGSSFEPNDLYEVINTARDPEGVPYWKFVNDGTKVKYVKAAADVVKSGTSTAGRGQLMKFFAGGHVISQRVTAGNPPVHMRERVLPMVKKYWKQAFANIIQSGKPFQYKVFQQKQYTTIGGESFTAPKMMLNTRGGHKLSAAGSTRDPITTALEDTMDLVVSSLEEMTPVLKDEYDASSFGYTAEPGLLRDSYEWREKSRSTTTGYQSPTTGKFRTSKSRATFTMLSKRHMERQATLDTAHNRKQKLGRYSKKVGELLKSIRNTSAQHRKA